MAKKIKFTFDQETAPGVWTKFNGVDSLIADIDAIDKFPEDQKKEAAQAVTDSIDVVWNGSLKEGDLPRRLNEIVSIENYVDPRRGDFDEDFWGIDENMSDDDEWESDEWDEEFDF